MTLQEIQDKVAAEIKVAYERGDEKIFISINIPNGSMKVAKSYAGLLIAPSNAEERAERTERQRQEKYEKKQDKHLERWRTDKK